VDVRLVVLLLRVRAHGRLQEWPDGLHGILSRGGRVEEALDPLHHRRLGLHVRHALLVFVFAGNVARRRLVLPVVGVFAVAHGALRFLGVRGSAVVVLVCIGVAVEAAVVGASVLFFHFVDLAHQPDLPDDGYDEEDDHEDERSDRVERVADADTEQSNETEL